MPKTTGPLPTIHTLSDSLEFLAWPNGAVEFRRRNSLSCVVISVDEQDDALRMMQKVQSGRNKMEEDKQMYLDADSTHGRDSFIPEVIQILRIERLHIDMDFDARPPERRVRIEFVGRSVTKPGAEIRIVEYGHSYGEALRRVRELIKAETGE